jgi:hypothetical protein
MLSYSALTSCALFLSPQVDAIINLMTNKVKALGKVPDRAACWDYYINEIRSFGGHLT